MTMRWALALLTMVIGLAASSAVSAQEKRIVHFAGFALSGDAAKSHDNFPYTKELIDNQGKNVQLDFNKSLFSKISSQTFENFKVTPDPGDYKKSDALVLAFMLTWENVSTERFEDFTKVAVNLQAQALLFDFSTKQIIAAYPFGVEYIDSVKGTPDHQRILSDVKTLYDTQSGGLFDAFIAVLHHVQPKTSFGARIQIVSTDISQPAADELTKNAIDPDQAKELLTNAFERYLSHNGDVPVLPHANNQAIGGVMAATFVNGDAFNFAIPPSDYQIHLTLDNLRKVQVSKTDAETALAYASYLGVKVVQPLSGTQYINASFKFAAVKVIANSGIPDDVAGYQESLLAISDQVTQQFKTPSNAWVKQWLVRQAGPNQLQQMPSLLDHSR
jgi:hypothetical protein